MDHLQIPIEANDLTWKQRCNERMEKLKTTQFPSQDAPSQPGLLQEELSGEKEIMIFEFYEAVENGNVDIFVDVLEQVSAEKEIPLCAIFDKVTQAGDSLLHVAAELGRERIAELIAYHFPGLLTRRNIRGDTVLHVAARSKNSDVIKVVLSQYAIEKSKNGVNLLENKDEEITRLTNEHGDTALHVAVYSRHLNGITDLLSADRPVVHYLNKSGRSPLYLAVVTGDVEILGHLLQIPFPANEPVPRCHGNSPLHAAILERNPDLLKEILGRKPELIYLRDEDGGTPLHYAAYIGYVEGVRILLNRSSLIALERSTKGHLPIHLACKKGHVEVIKELLQQEWPNPRVLLNQKGQNILHVAAKNGKNKLVKYLLRNRKIDQFTINEKDKNGNTPLHLASRNLFLGVLYEITRDKRIDMNLVNNEGLTARDVVWLRSKFPRTRREMLSDVILKNSGVPLKLKDMLRPQRQNSPNTDWNAKDVANTFLLVAILMVTVTFAAGFTVPGGVYSSDDPNPQNRGMAVLADKALFKIFMAFNIVAMYSSTIGSLILLWVQLGDNHVAHVAIGFAYLFLNLALLTMSVAFMAAVRLVVSNNSLIANVITVLAVIFISLILFLRLLGMFPLGIRLPLLRQVSGFFLWFLTRLLMYNSKPKDSDSQEANKDMGKDK